MITIGHRMLKSALLAALFATALMLPTVYADPADPAIGVWQTERADSGGFLHVNITSCDDRLCGTILRAFDKNNEPVADYEHLGKPMIMKMRIIGAGRYAKGKIWAPDNDKTYRSKMQLDGSNLIVNGCIAFICRSQTWIAVPAT